MNILLCKWDQEIYDLLIKNGHKITIILDNFDNTVYQAPLAEFEDYYIVPDFNSLEQIVEAATCLKNQGKFFDCIISHTEFSQLGAGIIADVLEISNFSFNTALRTRDKWLMKNIAKNIGIKHAKVKPLKDVVKLIQKEEKENEHLFPLVIKPSNGFGTLSTFFIKNEERLNSWLKNEENPHFLIRSSLWMAEEYISGDEYHANSIIRNGEVVFNSLFKYFSPIIEVDGVNNFAGYVYLTKDSSIDLYNSTSKIMKLYANEINLKDGCFHFELFIKNNEIYFSEIASRIAGGAINQSFREIFNLSMKEMYVNSILKEDINYKSINVDDSYSYCSVNIAPDKNGVINEVPSKENLEKINFLENYHLLKKKGDKITDHNSPTSWCLFIFLKIPNNEYSLEVVKNICLETQKLLKIGNHD